MKRGLIIKTVFSMLTKEEAEVIYSLIKNDVEEEAEVIYSLKNDVGQQGRRLHEKDFTLLKEFVRKTDHAIEELEG